MGLGMALVSGVAAAASAPADQGSGVVKFTGSIIDAPCSVVPDENGEKEVNLGQISKKQLENNGTSTPKNFEIKLENCDLAEGEKSVSVTFSGTPATGDKDLLGITGDASGAAIAITNGAGKLLKLGEKSDAQQLQNGDNTLAFSAYLKADAASGATIVPGTFNSVANFTLAYQ